MANRHPQDLEQQGGDDVNCTMTRETIESCDFAEHRHDNGTYTVSAIQISRLSVISLGLLDVILSGQGHRSFYVDDDLLIMDLDNGTWKFRLGEYHPIHRGIMLRLVEGEPLIPTRE